MEMHEAITRQFLDEHPEHIQGVRYLPDPKLGGESELMMDTEALIAFTDWTIAKGYGDPEKVRRFREELRRQFGK